MFSILILVLLFAVMYFLMIRPQKKREKEEREMRGALKVGDEVITIGGVVGKIEKITEKTVVISTGAGKNKIEFLKTAVASVVKGEAKQESKNEAAEKMAEEEKKPDRDKKVTPKKLTKKSDETAAEE